MCAAMKKAFGESISEKALGALLIACSIAAEASANEPMYLKLVPA